MEGGGGSRACGGRVPVRLSFRGRHGFDAEVGNGLGRPAASPLSVTCLLRFSCLSRALRLRNPCSPLVAPRCSLRFGLFRLSSDISVCGGDYSAV